MDDLAVAETSGVTSCGESPTLTTGTPKKIILTGFGSFSGHDSNPTEQIINHFKSHKSDVADDYAVLRVATEDVQNFCRDYYTDDDNAVYIHLGVSGLATTVCLEVYAYNNMTFRVPDEAGYQPQQERIVMQCEYDAVMQSDLPLSAIRAQVAEMHATASAETEIPVIALSSDPGRYLCNYIYYHSLQHFAQRRLPKHCVFIHVPPVETMPLELQIQIISQCVRLIRGHCASC